MRLKISTLLILAVFLVGAILTSQSFQPAFATSSNLADVCVLWLGGSYVGTTCTVSTSGGFIAGGDELVIPSGTTLVISNNADTGISSFGTISNSGTITVANSGSSSTGIFNGGFLTNNLGATIAVVNSGSNSIGITNEGTITNSGTITISNTAGTGIENPLFGTLDNNFAGTITNSGTITNLGIINNKCGSTYSGTTLTGIVNECAPCVYSGSVNWTISSSCQLSSDVNVTGNVTVQSPSVLVIPNGKTLNIDFANQHLLINSGSKVLIKSGGKIF